MDLATLEAQETRLILPRFTEDTALALGLLLVERARKEGLAVVIDLRTPDRTLFHAAMPGAAPLNDLWALRKSNTTLMYLMSSLRVGVRYRETGGSLAANGLDPLLYADHGGSFPLRVAGVGVVGAVTVSGLPQLEDHAVAMAALAALIGG